LGDKHQVRVHERNFRVALARLGARQWQVASRVGISPSSLCAILKGYRTADARLISRLAKVMKTEVSTLIENERRCLE